MVATRHPVQHFSPAFHEIAKQSNIDLKVLYWRDLIGGQHDPGFGREVKWDLDLLSGYEYWAPNSKSFIGKITQVFDWLGSTDPDCVLAFGWDSVVARQSLSYALWKHVPLLLYGDNSWQHRPSTLRSRMRDAVLGAICRRSAGAVTTGTFNREDFIRLGVHPARAFPGVYPIDVSQFSPIAKDRTLSKLVVGFAGKLIPRKGADELLEALGNLPKDLPWEGVFVGEGPERGRLEELADEIGISHRIRFMGFRNQSEMPEILRSMDVLVVPSYVDMRVLVVSEAMAVGTPAIVSSGTAVWGEGDQLVQGVTGWVYPSKHPNDLSALLVEIATDRDKLELVSRNCVEEIPKMGPKAFARHVEHAVRTVLSVD